MSVYELNESRVEVLHWKINGNPHLTMHCHYNTSHSLAVVLPSTHYYYVSSPLAYDHFSPVVGDTVTINTLTVNFVQGRSSAVVFHTRHRQICAVRLLTSFRAGAAD